MSTPANDERRALLAGDADESAAEDVKNPRYDGSVNAAAATPSEAKTQQQQDNTATHNNSSSLKPAGSDDGSSEKEEVQVPRDLTPALATQRRTLLVAYAACALIPAAWSAVAIGDHDRAMCDAYNISASACDVAGGLIVHAVAVLGFHAACLANRRRGWFDNKLPITDVAHHLTLLFLLLTISKVWLFDWSANHPGNTNAATTDIAIRSSLVVLAVLAPALCLYLNHRIHRVDIPAKVNLNTKSMLRILRPYFWPHGLGNRALIVFTWLLMGGGKACGVVAPLFLAQAVNQMQATPAQMPYGNLAIFATLSLVPRVLEEFQDMLVVNIWRIAYIEVADQTFRHVHSLSLDWHLKKKMGHVVRFMDRGMNAATSLVQYVAMYLGPAIAVAISAFIVFATEFNQPRVAAVTFLFMSFYGWITVVVTVWRKVFYTEMNEYDNEMHDKATDSLVNFETVKYFTNEELEAKSYVDSVTAYQQNERNSRLSVGVLNCAQASVMEYCRMVALMVAATSVVNHEDGFDLGKFMALQSYLMMIFTPFQFLGSIYELTIESLVDMENLSDLLAQEPDMVDHPDAVPLSPIAVSGGGASHGGSSAARVPPRSLSVEFKDVKFYYPSQNSTQGLQGVSFRIEPGTTTAIVGATGSGKTTVTRLLFRFYDVVDGAVLVDGRDVRKVTQKSLRQHIGIVPQDTVLFNDTIRHNIRYGRPDATDEEVVEAARQAQILPLIERLDKGWDTVVGERGLKLSGGEKQRVAIARCLLKNPPIVVLDEATSALDNHTEKEVQAALATLSGRTQIIVAHRLSTVRHADQIIVMGSGRILERGTFDELLANPQSAFASMWNAQVRAATLADNNNNNSNNNVVSQHTHTNDSTTTSAGSAGANRDPQTAIDEAMGAATGTTSSPNQDE